MIILTKFIYQIWYTNAVWYWTVSVTSYQCLSSPLVLQNLKFWCDWIVDSSLYISINFFLSSFFGLVYFDLVCRFFLLLSVICLKDYFFLLRSLSINQNKTRPNVRVRVRITSLICSNTGFDDSCYKKLSKMIPIDCWHRSAEKTTKKAQLGSRTKKNTTHQILNTVNCIEIARIRKPIIRFLLTTDLLIKRMDE